MCFLFSKAINTSLSFLQVISIDWGGWVSACSSITGVLEAELTQWCSSQRRMWLMGFWVEQCTANRPREQPAFLREPHTLCVPWAGGAAVPGRGEAAPPSAVQLRGQVRKWGNAFAASLWDWGLHGLCVQGRQEGCFAAWAFEIQAVIPITCIFKSP